MTAFLAIVKLTCKSAVRSHIFQILLAVLLFTIVALPMTVVGDGTAHAHIQVSLQYCLGAISFLLSISTIWLGCHVMGSDIESYQLHMVITKPISRIKVWFGKCTGIILVHAVLLVISAGLVYGLIIWQFNKKSFSIQEKQRIRNEVLVGRRVFMPTLPNTRKITEQIYQKRLKEIQAQKQNLSKNEKRTLLLEIQKQVFSSIGEAKAGQTHVWLYKGLTKDQKNSMYLRYRTYVGKVSSKEQRETMGLWAVRIELPVEMTQKDKKQDKNKAKKTRTFFSPRTSYPQKIMCGIFNEIVMSSFIIDDKGTAMVAFVNYDPQGKTLFFQVADGPKLLVKVSGFLGNYTRGIFMIFAKIVFLAGLSCAIGGVISIPTAIFSVISYLLFGSFSTYLIGIDNKMAAMGGPSTSSAYDIVGNFVSRGLMLMIIPMQKFEVSYLLAGGELIEFSYIGKVIILDILLKSIFVLGLGMWLYRRREMGLVIRK
jgi:hypothetical protein